jgi:hypothetical protein
LILTSESDEGEGGRSGRTAYVWYGGRTATAMVDGGSTYKSEGRSVFVLACVFPFSFPESGFFAEKNC